MSLDHQYQEETAVNQVVVEQSELLLYNDDINTFDHVINMLCKYCDHDFIQAEQCAWIVHNNGKCMIKRGEFSALKPICSALLDAGLSAKIL